jgi:hypothetical protein
MTSHSLDEPFGRLLCERVRAWYGLPVEIAVTESNLHQVVVLGLALTHFGVITLVARQGLFQGVPLALTYWHELGHLKGLPVPLTHFLLFLWPHRTGMTRVFITTTYAWHTRSAVVGTSLRSKSRW